MQDHSAEVGRVHMCKVQDWTSRNGKHMRSASYRKRLHLSCRRLG